MRILQYPETNRSFCKNSEVLKKTMRRNYKCVPNNDSLRKMDFSPLHLITKARTFNETRGGKLKTNKSRVFFIMNY